MWLAATSVSGFGFGDSSSKEQMVYRSQLRFIGSNPGHLHSVEVFQQIQQHWLSPSGVLVVNFVGILEHFSMSHGTSWGTAHGDRTHATEPLIKIIMIILMSDSQVVANLAQSVLLQLSVCRRETEAFIVATGAV